MPCLHPGPTGCPRTSSSRATEATSRANPLWPKVRHDEQFFYCCWEISRSKSSPFVLSLTFCFLPSFFRFCGTSKSKLPTGPTSPTSSKSEFHPAEEVNLHLLLIRFIVSNANKSKLSTLHHLITRIFKNEFYHFCTVFMFYFFCLITLICDTNVKYFNTPIFAGVQKSVFILCVK